MLGPNHKRLHRTIWKFHSNKSRMFKIISPLLLYKPHIWALISISCLLKITSWVCGSLSKHRVHHLSNGCPTECCHGSQRLAFKNVGRKTKNWSVCIMLFGRTIHVKWDFEDCLVSALLLHIPRIQCILDRTFSDGLWNQLLMSVFFCLCALADAYLNKQRICLSICLFLAAFVALKEPNNYYISIPDGLRNHFRKTMTLSSMGETFKDYQNVKLGFRMI